VPDKLLVRAGIGAPLAPLLVQLLDYVVQPLALFALLLHQRLAFFHVGHAHLVLRVDLRLQIVDIFHVLACHLKPGAPGRRGCEL
jgi:hypothetical protein